MMPHSEKNHERDDALTPAGTGADDSSQALYGEEAAANGRALLMAATGADTIEEALRIALSAAEPDVVDDH